MKKAFPKSTEDSYKKIFSGQILSVQYFSRKEWPESKQTKGKIPYARLWTVRVCYVTQPLVHSLFTECSVYFIHVGWLFSKGEIVSLVLNARCPYFSEERDKPSAYEKCQKYAKTTAHGCVLQLEVCLCANVGSLM